MAGLIKAIMQNNIKAAWRPQTIKELDDEMSQGLSVPTYAGVSMSENLAMNLPVVYACVRVRGETTGQLSLHLYKRKDKGADRAVGTSLYRLVHDEPSEEMTSINWRQAVQTHVDTWGNGYSYIDVARVGRNAGQINQLVVMDPARTRPFRDENNRLKYEYRRQLANGSLSEPIIYDMSQILHIAGMGYNGVVGFSPVQYNSQALGINSALEQFFGRVIGTGPHIRGVLGGQQPLSADALKAYSEGFKQQYSGLDKTGGILFSFGADKYTPVMIPLVDAEFLGQRKYSREELCGIWRVPPHMIAALERSTNNNIEFQGLEFSMYTMMPICKQWEQAMNKKLLTQREKAEGYYFEYDLKSLMRGDMKARAEWYKTMKEVGAYNANRILQAEGENQRDDEGGEKYWDEGPSGQGKQANESPSARAMQPILLDAAARIMRRENRDIAEKAEKWAGSDMDAFSGWLGSYWDKHQAACTEILTPIYATLGKPGMAINAAKTHVETLKDALRMAQMQGIDGIKACLEGREPEDMPLFEEVA